MKEFRCFLKLLALTTALSLSNCGGSSSGVEKVDPFAEGNLLEVLEGKWFASTCIQSLSDKSSSIEQMNFKFRRPFSWDDSFFEDDSLEFTGSLEIQDVEFDNAYCLGAGTRNHDLIESTVALNNISVVKSSITSDSFRAFYAQEKEFDFDRKLDLGSGIFFEFERRDGEFQVTPLHAFTYLGKNFDLQDFEKPEENQAFSFTHSKKPIQNLNFKDISDAKLKNFLQSPDGCGQYYIIDRTYKVHSGEYKGLLLVMQSHSEGLKLSLSNRTENKTNSFQTTNLDWFYERGEVHTDGGFSFHSAGSGILIQNDDLNIKQSISGETKNNNELINFLKTRGVSTEVFENCK